MSIPKKLDQNTASALHSILSSLNISSKNRIIIDLDNDTVEVEEDHNIDDLLQWAGTSNHRTSKRFAGKNQ